MKNIFNVIVLTLAVNFLAVAGGVGWLYRGGHLDRERALAIKEILFPKPVDAKPTTEPAADPTTQPMLQLDELLNKAAGRSALEKVELIQNVFDAKMAQLDRRQRELNDLQGQVELAKQQVSVDRSTLKTQQKALDTREQMATQLANDKGFQDSLNLYNAMPPKQVKAVFMTMDDPTMLNYLQAMEPPTAAKIIKEFKAPDEADRIAKIMKLMTPTAQASIKE